MTHPGIPPGYIATLEISRAALYQLLYNNSSTVTNPRNGLPPIDLARAEQIIAQHEAITANAKRPIHYYERVRATTKGSIHIVILHADLSFVGKGEVGRFDPRLYEYHNPGVNVAQLIEAYLATPDAATMRGSGVLDVEQARPA